MEKDWRTISYEEAKRVVESSYSYTQAIKKLGYTGVYKEPIKRLIEKYNLDISHFKGRVKNIIGNRYGKLTVISQRNSDCYCLCDCGNYITLKYGILNSGNTKSCGCLKAEILSERNKTGTIDITGQRCGSLIAIKDTGESNHCGHIWEFKCDCGKIVYHPTAILTSQRIRSCGCGRYSYGELKVQDILEENNIEYKREYTFEDLRGEKGDLLRFDFAVFENAHLKHLIEVDGEQHWDRENNFFSETIVRHDKMKNEYCLKNNIPLIRIPYYFYCKNLKDFTIKNLNPETSDFLIKHFQEGGEK